MNKKILYPGALMFSLVLLAGCGDKSDEADNAGVSGTGISNDAVLPSPFADDNAPAVELTPEETIEIERKAVSAKECTDGGGLFNTEMEKCFANSADEAAAIEEGATTLEVLGTDDKETQERKECINSGGTYNTEQKDCFKGVE